MATPSKDLPNVMTDRRNPFYTATVFASLLGAVACNTTPEKQAEKTAAAAEAAKPAVAAKGPETLINGSHPTIPDVFRGLEPGMAMEEAKKKLPSLPAETTIEDPAYGDLRFHAYVPEDGKRVENLRLKLPKDKALALVRAKWGEPVVGEDIGKPIQYWYNPELKLRASLKEGYGEDMDLTFERYEPLAKLLGDGPEIAFFAKVPVLGATVDALKAGYGPWFHAETADEAKSQKAALDKFTGGKTAGITSDMPDAYLDLAPTEYGDNFMRVNLSWDDAGKVESFRFGISYRQVPAKKDEILAQLEKKWGAPKKQEKYGKPLFVFSAKPFIGVEPNDISKQWDVKVQAKAD